ncbi:short-chain alcohol dehydrogenase [Fusarium irregulare]|uniref:Short-chain alcohol dehydrogenase n=1 Tax=Fusarium irregulare TaxID=2494466 RepID=A0A9W8PKA0_9HYPO|nr:short-chain alcohol dehydrogenase [Fusarium irregulare]KAJ4010017.1 short-chain alcohol dehydrogenase [Fusarium irregulare]
MSKFGAIIKQSFRIPPPTLTENNLVDQTGKVHIVTGGYAGCGQELVKILYQKNATIYVAGRSESKALESISDIKDRYPSSKGRLEFLAVDLSALSSIKKAVQTFEAKETRLDVLTNNAGVMWPPAGSKDHHGHELQMGTNCLGPFLFTELLLPILRSTVSVASPGSVRVTWAASLAGITNGLKDGVQFDAHGSPKVHGSATIDYGQSKFGNMILASEFSKRYGKDGILSVSFNPGNLQTELQRHVSSIGKMIISPMLHAPIYGAYTELYTGWSSEITSEHNGWYIIPWGRIDTQGLGRDVVKSLQSEKEGGSGVALAFWEWCDRETASFR